MVGEELPLLDSGVTTFSDAILVIKIGLLDLFGVWC